MFGRVFESKIVGWLILIVIWIAISPLLLYDVLRQLWTGERMTYEPKKVVHLANPPRSNDAKGIHGAGGEHT